MSLELVKQRCQLWER